MRRLVLVFDLDGTLVDSARDLMGTLNVVLAREGVAPLPVEAARNLLGAGARALLERGLMLGKRQVAPSRMDELYRDFLDHYAEHLADESRAYPGVEAALEALAAEGHILAVCTNKVTWHSERLLQALDLARRFAAICGRDAFPFFKPDARHLALTVEQAGGRLADAVMIGDSRTDVETARNAGVPSICVDFGYSDAPVAELGATAVISHFDALAAAITAVTAAAVPPP
jgi:phosphoglycolate phosphatase